MHHVISNSLHTFINIIKTFLETLIVIKKIQYIYENIFIRKTEVILLKPTSLTGIDKTLKL